MIFQLFVIGAIIALAITMYYGWDTIGHGIKTWQARKKGIGNITWFEYHLGFHKYCAKRFGISSLVFVFLIEGARATSHKHIVYGPLFWWHLCLFAIPFALLMIGIVGLKILIPRKIGWWHYVAGTACGTTFLGSLVLGGILFYRLIFT